jgi:hypothetical protein
MSMSNDSNDNIKPVAWCLTPPRWTVDHLVANNSFKTLCGLKIPSVVFNYDYSGSGEICQRCEKHQLGFPKS